MFGMEAALPIIFAQAETASAFGSLITALNLGLAGVGLLAFVRGWIVPGKTYEAALQREKDTKTELDYLRSSVDAKLIPELEKSRIMQSQLASLVESLMDYVDDDAKAK